MSLLNKQTNPDKWKNKYFDLLDKNDDLDKIYLLKEELLCKTIARLSLAATGVNKELDPHLLRIRKHLKNGLQSERLKSELEQFSKALMALEETVPEASETDTTLLFDFLFQHFPDQKIDFQHIEAKFEKNEFPNSQYLFIAINDQIDSIKKIEPLSDLVIGVLPDDTIDFKTVNTQLLQLIEVAEIPAKFETQAHSLKEKLYSNTPLATVLDETVSLLFKIKKHIQLEQEEMTEFLTQLTEQLAELGHKASGAQSASKSTAYKRNLLDESVSSQMLDLQNSSQNATKLEPLKQLIHTRLAEIAQQIQNQQAQDEIERDNVNQKLETLTSKISKMEQESRLLNLKLDSAHQKAIHDPLTGLPNRLAYDERLAIEISRWNRYKTPLSLLIWDIDLFKQINDKFGHKSGDKTLILIAQILSHHCRETDFVSRFGGEEFTMLLSNTDAQSALITANKLRQLIEKTAFNSNGKKISITISSGITQFVENDTGESAFNRADKALYEAKRNGRNQCIIL